MYSCSFFFKATGKIKQNILKLVKARPVGSYISNSICIDENLLEGGEFYPGKRYGKIKQIHFGKTGDSRSEAKNTTEENNYIHI